MGLRSLLSVEQIGRDEVESLLDRAAFFSSGGPIPRCLSGKTVCLGFWEPSTRTRIGFHVAATRLGGSVVEINEAKHEPRMTRSESFEDTIRVISDYCEVLVVRHPDASAVQAAAEVSSAPVVSAGAGREFHPTQALVDLFAVRRAFGKMDGLSYGIVGDLSGSRAAKSFLRALVRYRPSEVRLMAPVGREIPQSILEGFPAGAVRCVSELVAENLDVLYVAGLPEGLGRERISAEERAKFRVTVPVARRLPQNAIVLCPLPRIDEIDREVDRLPCAGYFAESRDGLWVRMAVLEAVA